MTGRTRKIALMGALACGMAAPAVQAQDAGETESLRQELQTLRAEVAELRAQQDQDWMTERRAEEIKTLIHDVLADAETRASLIQEGAMTAGYDDGFFLAAPDDSFLLEVWGQLQFRWLADYQDEDSRQHDSEQGFQVRRARLGFQGHIADPRLGYQFVIGTNRNSGNVSVDDAVISYQIAEGLTVLGGKTKLPFLREELLSSKRQLAIDRSSVTEYFTLDRSEQIALAYRGDAVRLTGSVNDGADTEFSQWDTDPVEVAVTGRADFRLAGEWSQSRDLVAWRDEPFGAFVGGAVHYQLGNSDGTNLTTANNGDYLGWTVDGMVESQGFSFMGAVNGGHISWDDGVLADDRDMYGVLAQAGYSVNERVQPFVRWEWLDDDAPGTSDLQMATAGFNYFLNGHAAKFTADVVWVYEGDAPMTNPFTNSGPFSDALGLSGFTNSADDDLVALRTQFQLLF